MFNLSYEVFIGVLWKISVVLFLGSKLIIFKYNIDNLWKMFLKYIIYVGLGIFKFFSILYV